MPPGAPADRRRAAPCCNTTDTPHTDLKTAHKDAFQLDAALPESQFNCKQKLILVGNTADSKLVQTVQYWQEKGVDIDFMPYRFYEIGGEMYFEFFASDACAAASELIIATAIIATIECLKFFINNDLLSMCNQPP